MIKPRMTQLNYNEILMYLGHRGQQLTPAVKDQLQQCIREVEEAAQPRLVYTRLFRKDAANLPLTGEDIGRLLQPCQELVLLAVTLGNQLEQILMRLEVKNMADAVILDACASVAVENVCDCFEEDLRREVEAEGLYLTSRFSPGYGDFPISSQKQLCQVLNASRRIGLNVTDSYLMVPRKSVTAVMGIADTPQELRKKGCEVCNMFLNCTYRVRGTACHE